MCGFIFTNEFNQNIDLKQIIDRGPDQQNLLINDKFIGFNSRLAIEGNQQSILPYKIGNTIIFYNGEIYNYKSNFGYKKIF